MIRQFPSTGFPHTETIIFSHHELRQVLSAYAEGVLHKGWKDYAIITEKNQTTFCVVDRSHHSEGSGGVIYSISRTRGQKSSKDYYRVYDKDRMICRSEKFLEALNIFRELDRK